MNGVKFEVACEQIMESIKSQVISRGYRVSNQIRNAVMRTLKGQGHGRVYRVPGSMGAYYTASAPGEVLAVRTGAYRASWKPRTEITPSGSGVTVNSICESEHEVNGYVLGALLEDGTSKMTPRPHVEKITKQTEKTAMKIYKEPYF